MFVIVMGVSGAGKTTLGAALASRLRWLLIEGDDLHPPQNIAKMRSGLPLEDADRTPWLESIACRLRELSDTQTSVIVACSALKESYRAVLAKVSGDMIFVYLKAQPRDTEQRLLQRKGHFMPANLMESQYAVLEEPNESSQVIILDAQAPLDESVDLVVARIAAKGGVHED